MVKKNSKPKRGIITYSKGTNFNVKLRGQRLSKGIISLYLDYYQGYNKTHDGKLNIKRKLEYLKKYIKENPSTKQEREKKQEILDLAHKIRNKRETDLEHSSEGFVSPTKKKINFLDYCQEYINSYNKKDIRMVKGAVRLFSEFIKESYIKPKEVNKKLVTKFKDFLKDNPKFTGSTPHSYFSRFKKILKQATEDGLFIDNPANDVTCEIQDGIIKDILMKDEIIKLAQTECGNAEVKRAFLFSLNTGLRFVDIQDLRYKDIKGELLIKHQQKTGKQVIIDLNTSAISLIGEIGNQEDNIFNLPSPPSCLKTLKNWTKRAGITKHITWHCARHSFATILLSNKTDIKTVQTLLGHSKIEHTQRYTHIVNELRKQAVNVMPDITNQ